MKTDINRFLLNIEHVLSDIRGSRYLDVRKVYLFVGHPVCSRITCKDWAQISEIE